MYVCVCGCMMWEVLALKSNFGCSNGCGSMRQWKKKRDVQCTGQRANCHGKEATKAGGKHTDGHTGRHAHGRQLQTDIGHSRNMIQVM